MKNEDQSWLIMSDREEFEVWAEEYGFHDGVADVHKYAEACAWDAWQAAQKKQTEAASKLHEYIEKYGAEDHMTLLIYEAIRALGKK